MINYTPPTQHNSLFYKSEEEYLDIVIPYLKAGLENNEFCLWAIPETLKIQDAQEHLRKSVEGLDGYFRKGQLLIGDYKSFYLKDGVFSIYITIEGILLLEKKALENGFKGLRATGDCSWALTSECWSMFMVYEKELNRIIESHKIRALCSYSVAALELKDICNLGINHQSSLVKQVGAWNRLDASRFAKADIYKI